MTKLLAASNNAELVLDVPYDFEIVASSVLPKKAIKAVSISTASPWVWSLSSYKKKKYSLKTGVTLKFKIKVCMYVYVCMYVESKMTCAFIQSFSRFNSTLALFCRLHPSLYVKYMRNIQADQCADGAYELDAYFYPLSRSNYECHYDTNTEVSHAFLSSSTYRPSSQTPTD